ncbi:MAG: YHS domain-containing protein [Acidobacteria bacterium]|nr:YHS domain-containing protein [Acidobacteriota bacterium]
MVTDLVCKMEIDETKAFSSLTFDGEKYFFCSEGCCAEFMRHPNEYRRRKMSDESDPPYENGNV